ncbi:MAG: ACT domain-containing protein, partial [Lachnospiraceae bacterium]|nr:ACT domain-containing protein [Lachnospiraceae bacterium]
DNTQDIAFTVVGDYADDAVKVIEDNKSRLKYQKLECEKGVAKVSIVGAGMMSNPGVAAKMFECLYNSNINIKMISTSEIRVTVLIDEKEVEKAVNAAHDIFGLAD